MLVVLALATALSALPPASASGDRAPCPNPGRSALASSDAGATGEYRCYGFFVNAGDELLVTARWTGGSAEVVAGAAYLPDGEIINDMQLFSSANGPSVHYCTATATGWYTLALAAFDGEGGASWYYTIDTTTSILVDRHLNAPLAEPGYAGASTLDSPVFALNAGMCLHF